ncbi:MAG: NlpC/P60 family protein [Liquorilactobacillus ghanensis]|uniref:C40 family peptidase n=1 Tax=Liquorilactobacillus ghanensis TaxID=399370 RepID=UPI0039E971B4
MVKRKKLWLLLAGAAFLISAGSVSVASASKTDEQISTVNSKIEQTQASVDQAQKTISKLQSQQTKDQVEIHALSKNINARKGHLAQQARSAQTNDTGSLITFLTDAKSLSDVIDRAAAVATMIHANNQTLSEQRNDKQKVVADKARVVAAAAKEKSLNNNLNQQLADLAVQKVELKVQKSKEDAARKQAEAALATAKKAAQTVKTTKNQVTAVKAVATANKAAATVTNVNKTDNNTKQTSNQPTNVAFNKPANNSSANNNSANKTANSSAAPSTSSVNTSSVVAAAVSLTKMNIPYVFGGASLSGMDCSGLTMYVYRMFGVNLPHNTVAQEGYVNYESVSQAQPGDLLFWGSKGASYHVAIYIGGGQFVHAPTEGQNVKISSISGFPPSFAGRIK